MVFKKADKRTITPVVTGALTIAGLPLHRSLSHVHTSLLPLSSLHVFFSGLEEQSRDMSEKCYNILGKVYHIGPSVETIKVGT